MCVNGTFIKKSIRIRICIFYRKRLDDKRLCHLSGVFTLTGYRDGRCLGKFKSGLSFLYRVCIRIVFVTYFIIILCKLDASEVHVGSGRDRTSGICLVRNIHHPDDVCCIIGSLRYTLDIIHSVSACRRFVSLELTLYINLDFVRLVVFQFIKDRTYAYRKSGTLIGFKDRL